MTTPNPTARHFDGRAAGYRSFRERWPLGVLQAEEEDAVRQLADVQPDQRVLEVGCGAGKTLAWLRQRGARPVGVDVSREMARQCAASGHVVSVQDMQRLAFRPVFDWVMCVGSLEFVDDPLRTLEGFAAVLRHGGSFLLLYPRRSALGRLYRLYHRANGIRIRLFSRDELRALFRTAGFSEPSPPIDGWLSSVCVARKIE